jgi:histidinol-phosphate/aromatic aminotransferase/cobyric acid decarboxylase-like protein
MIVHGALDHAELAALGLEPEGLIDFSSNLNPFGPPAAARAALAALDPAPYPDRSCRQLRVALAERHGCTPGEILAGNGANELIHLVARALLGPGASALVVGPTFGEYAHACRLAGAHVVEVCAHERGKFLLDAEALMAAVARARPRLTWLCAPNNPTGVDLPAEAILILAKTCAAFGGLLVVDRAYHSFLRAGAQGGDPLDAAPPANLLRLHSLTKSYALAGLRLGYLLAEPELVGRVAAYQPAWSVSSAAQAAGLAALADPAFLPDSLPRLWASSDTLRDGLIAMGQVVHRAELPFMLVRSGDAAATRAALLRRGCVVRDCTSFGLPAWVRLAPRRPAENLKLLSTWRDIL